MSAERAAPPAGEPTWIVAGDAPPDRAAAQRLLATLTPADRGTLVLSHGHGLPLGEVAWALDTDPSVVAWRLRRIFEPLGAGVERGAAAELRARVASGAAAADLPDGALERVEARRRGALTARAGARGGALGVGSLLLIVLAAAGFMVYGAIRDVNPLFRGRAQARQGDYEAARQSFVEVGRQPEARAWIAFCWLAEGDFDRALEVLREPEAARYVKASFLPSDAPLVPLEQDPDSPALLPRGLVFGSARPTFVFRPAPAGTLSLELTSSATGADAGRVLRWPIGDTTGREGFVAFPYPGDAPPLDPGTAVWTAPGGEDHPVSFAIPSREQLASMRRELEKISLEIPPTARDFLRGQFFLNHQLYAQAGEQFARLARKFPDQAWPRQEVERVARALAVDPSVFLR